MHILYNVYDSPLHKMLTRGARIGMAPWFIGHELEACGSA